MLRVRDLAVDIQGSPVLRGASFEVNAGESDSLRASCLEFILAGLHATDRISRAIKHGRIVYEV